MSLPVYSDTDLARIEASVRYTESLSQNLPPNPSDSPLVSRAPLRFAKVVSPLPANNDAPYTVDIYGRASVDLAVADSVIVEDAVMYIVSLDNLIMLSVGDVVWPVIRQGDYWWWQPSAITPNDYVGPFALSIDKSDDSILYVGENRAEASYYHNDHIIIGLDALAKTAAESLTSFSTGVNWVGYTITKSGATITATISKTVAAAPPSQADGTVYFTLGYVTADGGGSLTNLAQSYTGGDIHIPARIS